MTDELDTSEYIQDVDYGDMEILNISGAHNAVYLIPAEMNDTIPQVIVWGCIGSGQPEPAFNNRWFYVCSVPHTAVPSEVEKVLRHHEDILLELSGCYEGTIWDGYNHRGSWDIANLEPYLAEIQELMNEVPAYWEASDFFRPVSISDIVYNDLSLSEIISREVSLGAQAAMYLEADDVKDWLIATAEKWLADNSDQEDLDEDDELLYDRLTALLED